MWVLWLIAALLLVIAVMVLSRPLFRTYSDSELAQSQKQANRRKSLNIELYEQKKAQIEQDFANGLLDEEAKVQAQNEIEHSLIQDAEVSGSETLVQLSNGHAKVLTMTFMLFIPIFSVVTYAFIKPDNYDQVVLKQPLPEQPGSQQAPDINAMVVSLENKLKANPDNIQGWNMLGRSYVVMQRFADAVIAYGKAIELSKTSQESVPDLEINYVEALMQTGKKENYAKARTVLVDLLAKNPDDGDALWFMGFLDYEAGNKASVIERWTHLLSLLPPTSEQAQVVNSYLVQVKGEMSGAVNNIATDNATVQVQTETPSQVPPAQSTPGPVPGQQMTGSKEEQAFIASMIARVESRVKENPDDVKSWKTLGKSYGVLNRHVDSANAYAKAVALDSSDVDTLIKYANASIKTGEVSQLDSARIVFAQLLDQNDENVDALFLSGMLARAAGDTAEAKMFWNKLLPLLPEGSSAHTSVKNNLQSL